MPFEARETKEAVLGFESSARPARDSLAAERPKTKAGWKRLANVLGPCLGLFLVVGLFSLSPTVRPYFLTGANFKIILTQTVIVATGTLGMTIIIVSGGIDLSVGSVVALTSVVG